MERRRGTAVWARWGRVASVTLAVVCVAGCVTVEGTLHADGSATVRMVYRTAPNATEFLERRRFRSEHVTVDAVKIEEDGTTTLDARIDDATRISTASGFRDVIVWRERTGREERVSIVLVNRSPVPMKPDGRSGPVITLTFPGPVVMANEGGARRGNTVRWRFGLAEYIRRPSIELTVRYVPADPGPR